MPFGTVLALDFAVSQAEVLFRVLEERLDPPPHRVRPDDVLGSRGRRCSGLTPSEAADLLGRDCYKALKELAEAGEIKRVELGRTIVYVHRWPSRREKQVTARKTDERVDLDEPSPPVEEFLLQEELLEIET